MSPDALLPIHGARIAHLIESDGPGGAERVVAQLAGELQRGGCPAVAILPAGGEGWLAGELRAAGVAVEHLPLEHPASPWLVRELAVTLRRHCVSLVHSHDFTMAFCGAWAARRARMPHVITMHGGRYYAARIRRRLALRAAVALSRSLVAVSEPLATHLSRDLWIRRARIVTIPNGARFAPAARSTLRAELGLTDDSPLIVAVGNLYPVKGHTYLLEALGRLAPTHPRLQLAIAGRGDLAQVLQSQARDLNVEGRVHFLGLRQDIANILAAADVFALPSLSEGLPVALLEAMFASRPIVASAVGDVPAALASGAAGRLVPPGDAAALAGAIRGLLTNPFEARALGQTAQARATAEYGIGRMVQRYVEVYQRLLANGARRGASL
ncbi:MAG TPA: glycosyltransferase [Gemmatimonadales bacterium]|jgi:glycosyltransferase involved in cell wall biosynthesis|nr:glycosyltransferase [Gemmatimonadales bacterium]